jgi:transposase
MSRTRQRGRPSATPAPATAAGANPALQTTISRIVDPATNTPQPSPGQTDTPAPARPLTPIGVGIDTSRYGHHATFLRPDLQPAAADLDFAESAQGYQQLRDRLDAIATRHGPVHFHFRLDVAGRYADNLLAWLHALATPGTAAQAFAPCTISCGDPQRNKNYRAAIFGPKKSDPVESAAAARYALTEKPQPMPVVTPQTRLLCQIASRLESQARQGTRLVNQLHNLLARAFPELALLVKNINTGWVLQLLDRYPTAAKLAGARAASLEAIPYLPHEQVPRLLQHARASVASLTGTLAEELVRAQVRQLKDAHIQQKALENMLVTAYRQLPEPNHLDTIKGFGEVTAAILTAKIVDIHRFAEPGKLVGYFGIFPIEVSSGIDRDGQPRGPKRMVMSKRGNDLVRRYLYMAALSAAQHNPAVRPLYQRVRAQHPDHPGIAIGHAMRKLLHLAYAVWQSGKPFDPEHYPWDQAAHLEGSHQPAASPSHSAESTPAAGHNPETEPERSVVTAACGTPSVPEPAAAGNTQAGLAAGCLGSPSSDIAMSQTTPANDTAMSQTTPANDILMSNAAAAAPWIDFAHLKTQLPLQRVLEHLGVFADLRGSGPQRRGPCPVHAQGGQRRGRTFSVELDQNLFQCFDPKCGIKGDVIDLWAAVKGLNLRDAALELVRTFNLEPAPGTEKRNG